MRMNESLARLVAFGVAGLLAFGQATVCRAEDKPPLQGEFSVTSGVSLEPFGQDAGWFVRGEADLPLRRLGGFGFLGQIGVSYSHSVERYDTITSAVLGVLNDKNVSLSTLTVDMGFKLRYDELQSQDSMLRPYVNFGVGVPVYIVDSGGIVAGQVPEARELENSGFPTGHGNIMAGPYLGGGLEIRLGKGVFLGIDARHHFIGGNDADFTQVGLTLGFEF